MKITELITQYNELKKQIADKLEVELTLVFNEILKDQNEVISASWTQYTPYFNDGDECVFWVNSDYLYINEEDYDSCDEPTPLKDKIVKEISDILSEIPDDIMQDVFGDHVKVTFTKDKGFSTEEYYHD